MTPVEQPESVLWQRHHAHMVDVAFRLLGRIADAEDVVQEAFARLLRAGTDGIDDERAWLTVVVTRLCLDQLRSARFRHEDRSVVVDSDARIPSSSGPDPADRVTLDDSVRLAMFVVLERLSPAERT